MNTRQYEALRLPCETAEQTFRDRYRQTSGDVHTILTVIRYAGLNNGEPVWHGSADVRAIDRIPRDRSTWKRRDRRIVEKALRDLLQGVGDAEAEEFDPPIDLDVQFARHLVRPLTAAEVKRLPRHFREHAEPL